MEKLNSLLLTAETMAEEAAVINDAVLANYRLESTELAMVFSPEVKDYLPGCKSVFVHEDDSRRKKRDEDKITIITLPLLNKVIADTEDVAVLPVSEAGRVYRYGYLCAEVINLDKGLGLKITCEDLTDSPCLTPQDAKRRLDAFLVMWPYENIRVRYHHCERHSLKPYLVAGVLRWCLILDKANHRLDGVFVNVDDGGMSPFNIPEEYVSRVRCNARYRTRSCFVSPYRVYSFNGSSFELTEGCNYLLSRKEAIDIWRKAKGLFKLKESKLLPKDAVPVLFNGEKAYLLAADGPDFHHTRVILISAETGSIITEECNVPQKLVLVSRAYSETLDNTVIRVSEDGFIVELT